ncbi:MAG TPA: hypothetical protein VLX28_02135 [Thermoanaerobaculia bacterium]|nr:hypothetical protein [Thermoanaerobaculia bacterium]
MKNCHGGASPAGGLPLARSTAPVQRDGVSWPGAYYRLVLHANAEFPRHVEFAAPRSTSW